MEPNNQIQKASKQTLCKLPPGSPCTPQYNQTSTAETPTPIYPSAHSSSRTSYASAGNHVLITEADPAGFNIVSTIVATKGGSRPGRESVVFHTCVGDGKKKGDNGEKGGEIHDSF